LTVAYFDANAGVSGDMMLGALVDAGLGADGLKQVLSGLDLRGYEIDVRETLRAGFRACQVLVKLTADHHHERHLSDIIAIIDRSSLSQDVKKKAADVFVRLGQAEAGVHGKGIAQMHFHEVGAVDAIVDVVGTVAGLTALGVERVFFSPLRLGYGTVQCAHGLLPIPAPATAELLIGIPVYAGDIEGEMVTPTGAALAVTLSAGFGPMPAMTTRRLGLGAGSIDRGLPNILRCFLGEAAVDTEETTRELFILEANVDDMNPELFGHICALLREAGALDVWLTPIQMKKERPGTMLSVLAEPGLVPALRGIIFTESTTLGVRESRVWRTELQREIILIRVLNHTVRVKIGRRAGRIIQVAPEFDDCRELAVKEKHPLKLIYQKAVTAAWDHVTVKTGEISTH